MSRPGALRRTLTAMWNERREASYRTAQVCQNGHLITSAIELSPERQQKFCGKCGASTLTTWLGCNSPIHGYHDSPGIVSMRAVDIDAYCYHCGAGYPWTVARLEAGRELIELSNEEPSEKESLKNDLTAVTTDTPKGKVAGLRLKRFIAKAGAEIGPPLRQIVVDVATATIKKDLGL